MEKITISYKLSDFMDLKDKYNTPELSTNITNSDLLSNKTTNSDLLTSELFKYCKLSGGTVIIRDKILKQTDVIINSFMSGKDPNDIIFKNILIDQLNKINIKTFDTCYITLKNFNYSTREHFETLAYEILSRAMTDTIVIKSSELNINSISELYANIAYEFSALQIIQDKPIKFLSVLLEMCEKHFVDFSDINKPLDKNNQYRVDNFKGFMNFLGLLYKKTIISSTVILSCLSKLIFLIANPVLGITETENIFEGYLKLMNQIINFNKNTQEFNNKLRFIHNDIKIKNQTSPPKLRKFSMLAHSELEKRLCL